MLGGGFFSTMVKHSRIDAAQAELQAVRHDLDVFRRELADVGSFVNLPSIDLSGFARFADYFFDNFFVDWAIQNRIGEAHRKVDEARRQVDHLLVWLDEEDRRVRQALADVQRRREQLLTETGGQALNRQSGAFRRECAAVPCMVTTSLPRPALRAPLPADRRKAQPGRQVEQVEFRHGQAAEPGAPLPDPPAPPPKAQRCRSPGAAPPAG